MPEAIVPVEEGVLVSPQPSIVYRGQYSQRAISSHVITPEAIQKLANELHELSRQVITEQLASLTYSPNPDFSEQDFERSKLETIASATATFIVVGGAEQVVGLCDSKIDFSEWPQRIDQLRFVSALQAQQQGLRIDNSFEVDLDFRAPLFFPGHDPLQLPTPNESHVRVNGPNRNWVRSVLACVKETLVDNQPWRDALHSEKVYAVVSWLFLLPLSMGTAMTIDHNLTQDYETFVRVCSGVYFTLLTYAVLRGAYAGLRWAFPKLEFAGSVKTWQRVTACALILTIVMGIIVATIKKPLGL